MRRKRLVIFFLAAAGLVGLIFVSVGGIANFYYVKDSQYSKVDLLFLMSGAVRSRTALTARLYKAGYAEKLLVVGEEVSGDLAALGVEMTLAELAKRALVGNGVKEEDVTAISTSSSTLEDIRVLRKYLKRNKEVRSVMVVTSPYHKRRVRTVVKKLFNNIDVEISIVSERINTDGWFRRKSDLMWVWNETPKYIYYLFVLYSPL